MTDSTQHIRYRLTRSSGRALLPPTPAQGGMPGIPRAAHSARFVPELRNSPARCGSYHCLRYPTKKCCAVRLNLTPAVPPMRRFRAGSANSPSWRDLHAAWLRGVVRRLLSSGAIHYWFWPRQLPCHASKRPSSVSGSALTHTRSVRAAISRKSVSGSLMPDNSSVKISRSTATGLTCSSV